MLTNDIKLFAPKALKAIKAAKNILLHCHPQPDPDSIASAISMKKILNTMNKKATIIQGDTTIPDSLSFLIGNEEIERKNIFEVNLEEYDLFIVLDSARKAMISKKGEVVFPKSLKTLCIDHHDGNLVDFTDLHFVNSDYVSTTEIIFDLCKTWKVAMTPEIAAGLLLGIYSDSGNFCYKPTNFRTFERASKLAQNNPKFLDNTFQLENNINPERIYFRGRALDNLKLFFNGKVVVSEVDYDFFVEKNISEGDRSAEKSGIANSMKAVDGWEIAALITETKKNRCSISLRGRGRYNLLKIATYLGGGGHLQAAGAETEKSLAETRELLLKAISSVYPELENV